jgi:pteridine reductase
MALHEAGFNIIVHYRRSRNEAEQLANKLNRSRPDSATCLAADLALPVEARQLADDALAWQGSLDLLVNNASCFYNTPLAEASDADWERLIGTNLRAPFILSQRLAPVLKQQQGAIVNLVDIYAEKPLLRHPLYSVAKAGLAMLTQSLARELAPEVRVNGVAPGVILVPEGQQERLNDLIASVPLQRSGQPEDIASTIVWLATAAPYINGQIIRVDGGRSLSFTGG